MSKLFFEMTETEAQLQKNSLEYAQYQMSTGINGYGNGTMTREEHQETERSVLSSLGVAMSGVQKLIGEYASLEEGELLPEMEKADKIVEHPVYGLLWSSIFVTLMANKIGGLQFGIYRNCQISSRVFHTAVAALPLTKANRSDFE